MVKGSSSYQRPKWVQSVKHILGVSCHDIARTLQVVESELTHTLYILGVKRYIGKPVRHEFSCDNMVPDTFFVVSIQDMINLQALQVIAVILLATT